MRQGIAAKSAIRALKQGKFPTGETGSRYGLLTDEQVAGIRRVGWNFLADYRNDKVNKAPRPGIYDYLVGGGDPANVLRTDGWNQFYTLDDEIMPTAVWFDYIDAYIENTRYDLSKVVDILRERDDIVFPESRDHWTVDKDRPEIQRIPYYNADGGRTTYVPFFWLPTMEAMKLLEADMSNRYKTIFEQDLLGLRAGGAAKFDEFYAHTPEPAADEDDDGF